MIDLPNVTLFTVIGNPQESPRENNQIINRIINASCSKINFGEIKIISAQKNLSFDKNVNVQYIDGFNLRDYNHFMVKDLYKHIDTDYVLTFQNDGFILNPEKWSDVFFDYDWIGAPWPFINIDNKYGVGNGGFSLRSKKMLNFCKDLDYIDDIILSPEYSCTPEDYLICVVHYQKCIDAGIKFAPLDVAQKFSYEYPIIGNPEFNPLNTFGFHGVFQKELKHDPFRILLKKLFFDQL